MRPLVRAVLCTALALPTGAAGETDYTRLAAALVDEVLVPRYERHAESTAALEAVTRTLCANPDARALEAAHRAFHDAMDTWQAVSMFGFGPVNDVVGRARFQFWPDKRGTGARQLRRAIAAEDPSLLEPGALAGKSVALGDLQALERVLFSEPDALLVAGAYRCALAAAIAAYQAASAAELADEWTRPGGFRDLVHGAAEGNEAYFDARGPALDLFRGVVYALQSISAQKLGRPLGESLEEARPRRAESWRSRRSARNVIVNLDTVIALFATQGGFSDALREAESDPLAESIGSGLRDARGWIAALEAPLAEGVEQPAPRATLERVRAEIESLLVVVEGSVSIELALDVGFNESDGDG